MGGRIGVKVPAEGTVAGRRLNHTRQSMGAPRTSLWRCLEQVYFYNGQDPADSTALPQATRPRLSQACAE